MIIDRCASVRSEITSHLEETPSVARDWKTMAVVSL